MKSLRGLKNKTTDKDLAKDPTTTCQVKTQKSLTVYLILKFGSH